MQACPLMDSWPPLLDSGPMAWDVCFHFESHEPTPTAETQECGICLERLATAKFPSLSCCHRRFCFTCIRRFVAQHAADKKFPVGCPSPECKATISLSECQMFNVLPNVIETLQNLEAEYNIPEKDRFYCPWPSCSAVMKVPDKLAESDHPGLVCRNCKRMGCVRCKVLWHGGVSCQEFQERGEGTLSEEERGLAALARENQWQQCPHCQRWVERSAGCPHMTCRCQGQFCYTCGSKWVGGCTGPCKRKRVEEESWREESLRRQRLMLRDDRRRRRRAETELATPQSEETSQERKRARLLLSRAGTIAGTDSERPGAAVVFASAESQSSLASETPSGSSGLFASANRAEGGRARPLTLPGRGVGLFVTPGQVDLDPPSQAGTGRSTGAAGGGRDGVLRGDSATLSRASADEELAASFRVGGDARASAALEASVSYENGELERMLFASEERDMDWLFEAFEFSPQDHDTWGPSP